MQQNQNTQPQERSNKAQISSKSLSELVDLYNQLVGDKKKHIKKFSDRKTALRRIEDLLVGTSAKDIPAPAPTDEQRKKAVKQILKVSGEEKKQASKTLELEGKKVSMDLTVTSSTGLKTKLEQKYANPKKVSLSGKRSKYAGKKIYKIRKTNECLAGSVRWHNWELYKDGMTYEEFRAAGGGNNHLNWDVKNGLVELR